MIEHLRIEQIAIVDEAELESLGPTTESLADSIDRIASTIELTPVPDNAELDRLLHCRALDFTDTRHGIALDRYEQIALAQQLDLERDTQRILCDSEDFLEGTAAFLQKRKPNFEGR